MNVSHGCVNMPPADAADLLPDGDSRRPGHDHGQPAGGHLGQRLDRVVPVVAGSTWPGSATHMAVEACLSGSSFVSPSSLPADTGSVPLGTSSPGNDFAA